MKGGQRPLKLSGQPGASHNMPGKCEGSGRGEGDTGGKNLPALGHPLEELLTQAFGSALKAFVHPHANMCALCVQGPVHHTSWDILSGH